MSNDTNPAGVPGLQLVLELDMPLFSNARPLIFAVSISVFWVAALCGMPQDARAALDPPTGEVILVVAGNIRETNVGDEAHFDREMLTTLGMETLETTTPFEEGPQVFQGPRLAALLKAVGADGQVIIATALDGYTVEIPAQDMLDYPVILAMIWNGKEMGIRNKGPTWIVYPLDQYPELVGEKFSARSIWQLSSIRIR